MKTLLITIASLLALANPLYAQFTYDELSNPLDPGSDPFAVDEAYEKYRDWYLLRQVVSSDDILSIGRYKPDRSHFIFRCVARDNCQLNLRIKGSCRSNPANVRVSSDKQALTSSSVWDCTTTNEPGFIDLKVKAGAANDHEQLYALFRPATWVRFESDINDVKFSGMGFTAAYKRLVQYMDSLSW